MKEKIESIVKNAKLIADTIHSYDGVIRIITHYDTDGITSAAIMTRTLDRIGKDFHLSFLNQLDSKKMQKISEERYGMFLFLDLGSGNLGDMQKFFNSRKVIIADHHQIQGSIDGGNKNIIILNPLEFGISENISGSGVTYLIARALGKENTDLSALAVIGAVGDSQIGSIGENWGLFGLNKEILKDATTAKKINIGMGLRIWGRKGRPIHKALEYCTDPYIPGVSGSESAAVQFLSEIGIKMKNEDGSWKSLAQLTEEEQKKLADGIIKERIKGNETNPHYIFGEFYEFMEKDASYDVGEFATVINATGKTMNPWLGMSLCIGNSAEYSRVRDIYEGYRRDIGKALSWVEKNKSIIKENENGFYLMGGKNISEHIISNVVSILNKSGFSNNKPVFAFVDTEDGGVKISARLGGNPAEKINIMEIVLSAAKECGGEGGGHKMAAGAMIPKGKEEMFINIAEIILKNKRDEEELEKTMSKALAEKEVDDGKRNEGAERKTNPTGEEGAGTEAGRNKKVEGEGLVRYLGA
jgi:RecJ-like exonuclease